MSFTIHQIKQILEPLGFTRRLGFPDNISGDGVPPEDRALPCSLCTFIRPINSKQWVVRVESTENLTSIWMGLSYDRPDSAFIGTVYRSFNSEQLRKGCVAVIREIEQTCADETRLKCPDCNSWMKFTEGKLGKPYLECLCNASWKKGRPIPPLINMQATQT